MVLQAGARPHIPTSYRDRIHRQTMLNRIVKSDDYDSMDFLLKSGFDLNTKDEEGKTALHLSAEHGAEAITDMLLKAGSNANTQDVHGWTPLFYALAEHELDIMDTLLRKSDLSLRTNKRETALHVVFDYGVYGRASEVLETLIEGGVDINAYNADPQTALKKSISSFDLESMEILMDAGCDLNNLGGYGGNLLNHVASYPLSYGLTRRPYQLGIMTEMGRMLIEAGIDVDDGHCVRFNPLVYSVYTEKCGLVRELLQANCETKRFKEAARTDSRTLNSGDSLSEYLTDAYEEHYMHFASFLYVDCCCAPEDQHIQQIFFDFCGDHEESLRKEGIDLDRPPLSLARLCRVALRSSLPRGCSFQSAVDQLPLPSLLKDFVGLRESPLYKVFASQSPAITDKVCHADVNKD